MSTPNEPAASADIPESEDAPTLPPNEGSATDSDAAVSRKRLPIIALVGGGVVVMAAIAWVVVAAMQPTPLEAAAEACAGSKPLDALIEEIGGDGALGEETELAALFNGVVTVEDDGATLLVDTRSQDEDPLGVTSLALDCVYDELEVPTRVTESIAQTRALDGRQSDAWGDFTAQWSYHPDSGASVIIARK